MVSSTLPMIKWLWQLCTSWMGRWCQTRTLQWGGSWTTAATGFCQERRTTVCGSGISHLRFAAPTFYMQMLFPSHDSLQVDDLQLYQFFSKRFQSLVSAKGKLCSKCPNVLSIHLWSIYWRYHCIHSMYMWPKKDRYRLCSCQGLYFSGIRNNKSETFNLILRTSLYHLYLGNRSLFVHDLQASS